MRRASVDGRKAIEDTARSESNRGPWIFIAVILALLAAAAIFLR